MRTSVDAGHSHAYKPGDRYTSKDDDHEHKLPTVGVYTSRSGKDRHRHTIEYKKQKKR